MNEPRFDARIPVSQTGADIHFVGMLGFSMLCAAPFFAAALWFADESPTGWRAAASALAGVGLILVACVAMLAGLVGWMVLETKWRRWRGQPDLFNETTAVAVGPLGLTIDGLGHADWADVLSTEGVPDSDSHLILHTRPFGKVMLQAPLDTLAATVAHYLDRPGDAEPADTPLRAIVFSWPRFCAWIWTGYALAGAVAVGLIFVNPHAGTFKTLVALGVLMPLTAWLVWWIPFAQLGTFSAKRVRAFTLDGTELRSTDGRWAVDLRQHPAVYREARGVGYALEFLTLRPREGGRFDIVLGQAPEHHALLSTLRDRGLLSSPDPVHSQR
jgi:hypothetical protein